MHYDLIIRNGICVLPWGEARTDIGVRGGRIASLSVSMADEADEVIDAAGLHVLPGLIDPHVHLRDPGNAAVESIPTGTRAAALGGVTTVFDMPNTAPSITDGDMLRWKQEYASRESWVDFAMYVGATRGNTPRLGEYEQFDGVCAVKVFAGSSTGDLMIEDDEGIRQVLEHGHRRVAFHSEDEYRLQARRKLLTEGMSYESHPFWRDEECAFLGTRRIVGLARRARRPVHILHTSTAEELDWLAGHRDIATVEVLVNHLTQVAPDCYETLGALAVMNPPIRDRRHYEASWEAVRSGMVDTIGSDHAPHSLEAKAKPWPATPAGLTGVQTLVPVMLDHVNAGRLSLGRMVDLMAAGPARVYGLQAKGRIAMGYDADFTLVDMAAKRRITNDWIATPAGWTPFDGMAVTGWPMATIVRGQAVMREDTILGAPVGRLACFAP
ncbi:dihydroorotase [Gluconacetobacter liquefaciens]|uniref:Dihydroorotase n=1 Tax=Gluconacetobacter liquefaciens TaxID=89584 RepID=A0A370G178_GLULI|nr:dihydroorotase [Gluconacetobacter liquefaciens]MBB2187390.1 dihydroorotase [Gluconacetobacter liquefaciens]RDI36354.1 dihydroorotase [Gluconacetobacter liquefaciens]GBQ92763.1 dihydroorotase [Gluconacetobacter liquefaciens NRIC 0522]GEB37908.1 dihydroorotase [Gluconacetobacter liquefaciens]